MSVNGNGPGGLVPLLDRGRELAGLDQAWTTATSKQPVFAFIQGDAGIGKTTLLNAWVERTRPAVHIRVDFSGNLGATTSALIEAFQLVLDKRGEDRERWKDDLLERLGRDGSGFREVFPGFPGNSWFHPVALLLDGEQLNRRFVQLLKSLVFVWTRCHGTVLLTIENWHLADDSLQNILLQLAPDGAPVLFVATSRRPLTEREAMGRWLPQTTELTPFSPEKVRQWIGQLFPSESAQRLEFYEELCEHAAGNPLHLQEILRVIGNRQASEMVRFSLDSWLDQKVRDLQPEIRRFLEAGAVLGSAFRTTTALECSQLPGEVRSLADEAVQRRFVTESSGVCTWIHDLIRDAMLRSIDPALHARLSAMAVLHIIGQQSQTRERLLMLPTFFRGGRGSLDLTEEQRRSARQLFLASANLMRRMMNLAGARSTLELLRSFTAQDGARASDDILMLSAEVAFESGEIAEAVGLFQQTGRNLPPISAIRRELILCRCYYVMRNFSAIFKQITKFAGILGPARLVSLLGPSGIGFCLSMLIPVLAFRMRRFSPVRVSRRRELTEHLQIALVFFTFQHYHTLSSALGLLFVLTSALRRQSHNLPIAGLIAGMFWNLPRHAKRRSLALARLANEKQAAAGNPIWNIRFQFIRALFYVPSLSGVREMWKTYEQLAATHDRLADPEVETIVKLDLPTAWFWSRVSMQDLFDRLQGYARLALEKGNTDLAAVFDFLARPISRVIHGEGQPYRLTDDELEEAALFEVLKQRKEFFVGSGLRFRQALFAIFVGDAGKAVAYVDEALQFPRHTAYEIPRIFDTYTECLARLLARGAGSLKVPYRILESTVVRNPKEYGPYLTHVDAEKARNAGLRDTALWLYQKARADFHRLDRPLLAALVDWRTGDLFWEESDHEIAQAYLRRAIEEFRDAGMNSSVNAIRSRYGLPAPEARQGNEQEDYLTVALRLHRLTLLGKLAAETTHEIKNVNHTVRLSADLLRKDFDSLAGRMDHDPAAASMLRCIRLIQDSAGRIDGFLNQFRLSGSDSSAAAMGMIDLGEVIRNTVQVMEPVIRRFTKRFTCDLSSGGHLISGQASKIEQVVMNLVLNACEALPSADRRIALRWADETDPGRVGFQLTDEGCGISDELLSRIREPFFTTKSAQGGTGLGLSVCGSIVESHNGLMRIDSKQGVGTTVTVLFPRMA